MVLKVLSKSELILHYTQQLILSIPGSVVSYIIYRAIVIISNGIPGHLGNDDRMLGYWP